MICRIKPNTPRAACWHVTILAFSHSREQQCNADPQGARARQSPLPYKMADAQPDLRDAPARPGKPTPVALRNCPKCERGLLSSRPAFLAHVAKLHTYCSDFNADEQQLANITFCGAWPQVGCWHPPQMQRQSYSAQAGTARTQPAKPARARPGPTHGHRHSLAPLANPKPGRGRAFAGAPRCSRGPWTCHSCRMHRSRRQRGRRAQPAAARRPRAGTI